MLESMQTHKENVLYHVWLISHNAFLGSIQDFYSYLLFLTVQDKELKMVQFKSSVNMVNYGRC
ncbi:hypothetical protein NSTCB13_00130 [Nostoc sp. DSM 114160]|jgi:hypothetical protein